MLKARASTIVLVSIGIILAATGLAKIWSALGASRALLVPDPLLGFSYKHLLAGVAVIEIVVATLCFLGRSRTVTTALAAYLCTNFLFYRIGLWWIGWKQPCGCMGSLTDALHIKPETADHIAQMLLLYMLAASYTLLWKQWKSRGEAADIGSRSSPAKTKEKAER